MFGRKKDGDENDDAATEKETGTQNPVTGEEEDPLEAAGISAPPLKPFTRKGSHAPAKPPATPMRGDIPRRAAEIPGGGPRRLDRPRAGGEEDAKKLTVGRDICLNGQITACDKLVVEGRVEAELSDARIIEVAPTGTFKGAADVEEADISGRFDGELTVRGKLTVRASGRIHGAVNYGRIVIEAGGEITGQMQALSQVDGG